MLLGPKCSCSSRDRSLQSSLEVCPAEGLEVQRPSLVNRPWQQTVLMYRVPSSHVICTVTCGGDRKEPSIEKVETGLEYSSGKGPGFDPLAPQKTEEEARRGRKAEGG